MRNVSLKNIALVILVSAILGFLNNFLSPKGLDLIRVENELKFSDDQNSYSINHPSKTDDILAITLDQAYNNFITKEAQFIDARDNWDFGDGHIKDAINIPEFSFERDNKRIAELDKTTKYIIYCSSNDCDISKRLAGEL